MILTAGLDIFDDTVGKTQELLREIETEMGWTDRRGQAYSLLRSALHTIRDELTVEETIQFSAQLPLLVKGILIDGWSPAKDSSKRDIGDFIEAFRSRFPFAMEQTPQEALRVVMRSLGRFVSSGEEADIYGNLPKDIVRIFA